MLIAAAAGDEKRFDSMWAWTKDNIQRPDGLLSFLWRDGKVVDPQAASDADVDAARALLAGSCRFNRPGLRKEALDLANAFMANETASFQGSGRAGGRPVGPQGPDHRQPQLLLARHLRGSRHRLGRRPLGQHVGHLAHGHRLVDAAQDAAAAGLGAGGGRHGRADRVAQPAGRSPPVRIRRRANACPDGRGSRSGGPAYRRPRVAGLRRPQAGGHTGGARAVGQAGRQLARIPWCWWPRPGRRTPPARPRQRDRLLAAAEKLDKRSPTYYGAAWVALGRIMLTTDALNCA